MPLRLLSLIRDNGELEISLEEFALPEPRIDEVVVRIEASPNSKPRSWALAAKGQASGAKSLSSVIGIIIASPYPVCKKFQIKVRPREIFDGRNISPGFPDIIIGTGRL